MIKQKLSALIILLLIVFGFVFHKSVYALLDRLNAFYIKKIEVNGAVLSRDFYFDSILTQNTNAVQGNLDKLNIYKLKHDLEQLELVKTADIQKNLPNTLTIDIVERQPVAVLKS